MEKGKDKAVKMKEASKTQPKRSECPWVDANMYIGGNFGFVNSKLDYVGGQIYVKLCLWLSDLDIASLRREVMTACTHIYGKPHEHFSIWYCAKGRNLNNGRMRCEDVDDIKRMLEGKDAYNRVNIYVIFEDPPPLSPKRQYRCKNLHFPTASKLSGRVDSSEKSTIVLKGEGRTMQIKTLNLEHTCGYQDTNPKVSSQFLADKYLDHWRADPNLGLKSFTRLVQRDLGVQINYYKAWYARARAKLMLYGDALEEYARVFDYAHALLTHNPGSTVVVKCEGVDSGTPTFQRMYVCLDACKKGFSAGCRPLVGVDGCHLKGAYPGMILVAVGKDGNNCIYPIAWAIVEVENKETWTWFMSLLVADINKAEGEGITLISDRQKGLLDAITTCMPKAEVRYCVRHIWANFKLSFSGTTFKEHFWHAARTCNKNTFNAELQCIKAMSEDAYAYLEAIPAKHWARHAFQTFSKSNMLLNNICETFNAVIREARDKPIITCLEWIRKYVMRRIFEKRQSVDKVNTRMMPYVSQVFKRVSAEANNCYVMQCSADEWEVSHNDDTLVVNLKDRTCTCNKWALSGIPCAHAFSCIIKRRQNPEDYVDHHYFKDVYIEAYNNNVRAMPGIKHWVDQGLIRPNPPVLRKMPGRPSHKKRKKEAGEEGEKRYVKRMKKQNNCSNCGQPGHYKTKCKNPPMSSKAKDAGGRPYAEDVWVKNQRTKKQAKVQAVKTALGQSSQSSQSIAADGPMLSQTTQPSQPDTASMPHKVGDRVIGKSSRAKLAIKPNKKIRVMEERM